MLPWWKSLYTEIWCDSYRVRKLEAWQDSPVTRKQMKSLSRGRDQCVFALFASVTRWKKLVNITKINNWLTYCRLTYINRHWRQYQACISWEQTLTAQHYAAIMSNTVIHHSPLLLSLTIYIYSCFISRIKHQSWILFASWIILHWILSSYEINFTESKKCLMDLFKSWFWEAYVFIVLASILPPCDMKLNVTQVPHCSKESWYVVFMVAARAINRIRISIQIVTIILIKSFFFLCSHFARTARYLGLKNVFFPL